MNLCDDLLWLLVDKVVKLLYVIEEEKKELLIELYGRWYLRWCSIIVIDVLGFLILIDNIEKEFLDKKIFLVVDVIMKFDLKKCGFIVLRGMIFLLKYFKIGIVIWFLL